VAALLSLGLGAAASATASPAFPRFSESYCARHDFTSGGTHVRAELCRAPRDAAAGRAVVILHGCGGFDTFDHRLATSLPLERLSTLYVDYFAATPPPGKKGWCGGGRPPGGQRTPGDPFTSWTRIVTAAVAALDRVPGIVPAHVGLVGWSLGGGLAVAVAQSDPAVHAVAAFSTGLFGGRQERVAHTAPLLLLSAGRTDAVPLEWTLALYRAARDAGTDVSLFVYRHGTHSWPRRQGTVGIDRAAAFLDTIL
jgi:dienelactone hydrolase